MIDKYSKVILSDGRIGIVVDVLGPDYVVDIMTGPEEWETILVDGSEIEQV